MTAVTGLFVDQSPLADALYIDFIGRKAVSEDKEHFQ